MSTVAVEVVYRGIFQKTLARNIVRSIVFAARKEGKYGTAFGRYGDSPERNGIPAKQFAIVADDPEELEENLAVYEAQEVDVTINVDDTMCKGIESWAWYGLQPINALTKPGGTLIVTSRQDHDSLIQDIHRKDEPYNLSVVTSVPSFSGLWVYKDDHTDVRILGALAKVCPQLVSLESMVEAIQDQGWDDLKVRSAERAYERAAARPVNPVRATTKRPSASTCPAGRRWRRASSSAASSKAAVSAAARAATSRYAVPCSRSSAPGLCARWSTSRPASSVPSAGCNARTPALMLPRTGCTTPIWIPAAAVGSAKRSARWPTA